MRFLTITGYAATAALFFAAWLRPAVPRNQKLIAWVSFDKLCLTEFLSCHALTLLAGTAMAMKMEGGSTEYNRAYWGLIGFYAVMAGAAFLIHRNHRALLGFYLTLVARAFGVATLRSPDEDMMRAEVLKNMVMLPAMMLLISGIAFTEQPDEILDGPGQVRETGRGFSGLLRKIVDGRTTLYVVVYYLLWAIVTWTWPLRIAP